ncbi:MAG TPA: CHASE2 domain-containing protein [Rhizomicrobium sp.]|jgi:hypothetical protein
MAEQPKKKKPRGAVRNVIHRVRRPDRVHMALLSERAPFWFVAAFLFAFSVFQIEMNPFGFSDLTQRYTQDIADLLITGPYFYGAEGRDNVSVVLIDESTLRETNQPWPWSFAQHAKVLDAIRAYKPKAVIVDFLFVDPRPDPTVPQMQDQIARYKKHNVPLYLMGATETPYGESPLRPDLASTGVPILDPTLPVYNGVARQYDVTGKCFNRKPRADGTCYTTALQVFADVYPQQKLEPLNGELELVWGTAPNPYNATWMGKDCGHQPTPLMRIYLAFFDTSSVLNPCPYNGVVPVKKLLGENDDPDVAALIKDHVVFYGGSLEGAQDKIYSPVNGLVAGVFVHAMAMDNLVTYHGDPEQNVMTVGGTVISTNPAQILAIVPVILVLAWLQRQRTRRKKRLEARQGSKEHSVTFEYFLDKTVETVWHYLAFGLALGVGFLLTKASGLSVANWVEVVFVSVELAAMLLVGAPGSLWGYLHHVAVGAPPTEEESSA